MLKYNQQIKQNNLLDAERKSEDKNMSRLVLVANKNNEMVTVESREFKNKMEFEKSARATGYQVVCVLNDENIKNIIAGEGKLVALLEKRNKKAVPFIRENCKVEKSLQDWVSELISTGLICFKSKELYAELKKELKDAEIKARGRYAGKEYRIELA